MEKIFWVKQTVKKILWTKKLQPNMKVNYTFEKIPGGKICQKDNNALVVAIRWYKITSKNFCVRFVTSNFLKQTYIVDSLKDGHSRKQRYWLFRSPEHVGAERDILAGHLRHEYGNSQSHGDTSQFTYVQNHFGQSTFWLR